MATSRVTWCLRSRLSDGNATFSMVFSPSSSRKPARKAAGSAKDSDRFTTSTNELPPPRRLQASCTDSSSFCEE